MSVEYDKEDYQLTCPLSLEGTPVRAGIDSMATKSFITPKLLQACKGTLKKDEGTISLAAKGAVAARIGEATLIVLLMNKTFAHTFEVLPLSPPFDCIVGLDLLRKAGLEIKGIPAMFPTTSETPGPVATPELPKSGK